jgi:superfamily II DNA/RNA helicase
MPPTFADLGVPARLCARLDELGIAEPFPVQAATIPDALAGRDVCGKAPTGSGKTIAFGLPLLARVGRARARRPRALVLVPTRELASQVQEQLQLLSAGSGLTILAVYGGAGMQQQMKVLGSGAEIVVATPGRLKDLIDRGSLRLDEVDLVVVDEADRMADMGFLPEVRRLLDQVRPDRQTLLFSATLDGDVDVLIKRYQRDPARHEAASIEEQGEVTHRFWSVSHGERVAVATAFAERVWPSIVFTRTRHGADRLAKQLKKAGVRAEAIHGDRSQNQRERALGAFGTGQVHVLVATDVAARGIHVDGVAGVLQYDAPATDKDYVHRSGRTGRAGAEGLVLTMTTPEKEKALRQLQRELRRREPIEAVTAASAAEQLGVAPPKPIDRGDGLDGVPRREQRRADVERVADVGRPSAGRRKPTHRKGKSPRQVAEGDWVPRSKSRKPAAAKGRTGQERAGSPARSGRPGAKPGRRPAGAGAARQGRPASGNARRRSR